MYDDICKIWSTYIINEPGDVDKYLSDFKILFAYHSNKIENNEVTYHNTRDIFEKGTVSGFTGDIRTLFELRNQKLGYEFLCNSISAKSKITKEFLLHTHKILMNNCYDDERYAEKGERPGTFKKRHYVVGRFEEGSHPDLVEDEIANLLSEIGSFDYTDHKKVLKAAAYFHCVFENIHPFADGNGRTGRTLLNYFLLINNHPPLIIYEEDKSLYFECLEKFYTSDSIDSMVSFLEYCVEKTWRRLVEPKESNRRLGSKVFKDHLDD